MSTRRFVGCPFAAVGCPLLALLVAGFPPWPGWGCLQSSRPTRCLCSVCLRVWPGQMVSFRFLSLSMFVWLACIRPGPGGCAWDHLCLLACLAKPKCFSSCSVSFCCRSSLVAGVFCRVVWFPCAPMGPCSNEPPPLGAFAWTTLVWRVTWKESWRRLSH